MGLEKITIKLQEALQGAQRLASKSGHAELKCEHLLLGLLQQEGGLAVHLLEKAGVDLTVLKANLITLLDREPQVEGVSGQPQLERNLRAMLDFADEVRSEMGDEFLSIEHVVLSMMKGGGSGNELLVGAGAAEEALENSVREVRGSQTVTDENPEEKYQALEKYGTDLCVLAREGKRGARAGGSADVGEAEARAGAGGGGAAAVRGGSGGAGAPPSPRSRNDSASSVLFSMY